MSIGIIGAGALGSNVARLLAKSGISATIANGGNQMPRLRIYLERGDRPGSALDDWLQAERELGRTS